jgi:hypothetical protein
MKKCDYCGRENSDEAAHCGECGTEFVAPSVAKEPAEPRDRPWLDWLGLCLRLAAAILGIGLVYLLSFGPVERYCGKTISQTTLTTTNTVNSQTTVITSVRRVTYPRWVGVVYQPAFMVRGNVVYERYLQWWDERP